MHNFNTWTIILNQVILVICTINMNQSSINQTIQIRYSEDLILEDNTLVIIFGFTLKQRVKKVGRQECLVQSIIGEIHITSRNILSKDAGIGSER